MMPSSSAPEPQKSGAIVATPSPNGHDDSAPHLPFGASLEPVLRGACGGRLAGVSWFRTTWQRGGAATGYSTFTTDDSRPVPVVIKLPLPPSELDWLRRLQPAGVVPRVYAGDTKLGEYDLAWVVMERLPHGPLNHHWNGSEFDLIIEAIGRFYLASRATPLAEPPVEKDWKHILDQARRHIAQDHDVQNEQRWKNALKKAQKKLPEWLTIWNNRPKNDWCHGDLHLANAMTRCEAPGGPAVLLDFAQVHTGSWVEDAIYLEHLYWTRRQRLAGRKLASQIAHERKKHGLRVDADWPRLAAIKRALLAASTPAQLQADGEVHHVAAALEVLELEVGH